ncbi:MAG: cell division protein FtsK [Chlamydiae bacterium RIFCSPLOWO2_12_FULL_49_12]|nr:MAG: cell division protein FtsK [Chlamydiae bacterium GWF2_49_8]OGN58637.1 MAG: cell division protein FtsK [Chlamydiae bacterium RIFCSPHIGHO2_02_FULL_49_29]OGN72683.1 MAG: cell division protein FtsK [Chlamydiae bacterium RIFCSPLOWO2_12_FULL_49_12]HCJ83197.1 DNA translocase FtsK [Parachlamydiales bacterium]
MKKREEEGRHHEVQGLALFAGALVLLLSLVSFNATDSAHNWLGLIGHSIAWSLHWCLGFSSYLLVSGSLLLGWKILSSRKTPPWKIKLVYLSLLLFSSSMLLNLFAETHPLFSSRFYHFSLSETLLLPDPFPHTSTRHFLGGVPLYSLYLDLPKFNLQRLLSNGGIFLTFSLLGTLSFFLFFDIALTKLSSAPSRLFVWLRPKITPFLREIFLFSSQKSKEEPDLFLSEVEKSLTHSSSMPKPLYTPEEKREAPPSAFLLKKKAPEEQESALPAAKREKALSSQRVYNGDFASYHLPPPSLLKNPKKIDQPALKKELRRQAEILEETLLSFGIEAKVGEIHSGPTITSFEVHPAIGVKVQKIKTLENDIALNLQAKAIRILAPIPGKAAVGIEIPSLYPQEVNLKELVSEYQKQPRRFHIPFLIGKTVSGESVMADLTRMPHCIIAGATGSGKSVCINTLILSILMNSRPDEVKLLLIDPKKVELTPYHELPHLISPVITEPRGAYAALSYLVKEMLIRYDILKQLGLRNINAFNNRKINQEFEASLSVAIPVRMFCIVAVIDEFADLMMASSTDLETPIARIAQMARAVGIHLILATQRPSREVITGLIKANFPSRIAFKVASRVNSQIILDENGAESLLGNGDLLFLPPGSSHLIRAQGAFVGDEEIQRIVSYICDQAPPNYLIESFDRMPADEFLLSESSEEGKDSLYDGALGIVLETRTASTTFLQRKLKIGYARAASLMDELEANGVIGPQDGSKPRQVFKSAPQLPLPFEREKP